MFRRAPVTAASLTGHARSASGVWGSAISIVRARDMDMIQGPPPALPQLAKFARVERQAAPKHLIYNREWLGDD